MEMVNEEIESRSRFSLTSVETKTGMVVAAAPIPRDEVEDMNGLILNPLVDVKVEEPAVV